MYRGKLRSGNVDIAKFIACLLIMAHHLHILGIESYPFYNSWIYVEFFLMITGYYTCAHYDGKEVTNKIKDGLSYTLRKFATILPYTVVVTVLAYVTDGVYKLICHEWSISSFVYSFLMNFSLMFCY